MGGNKFRPYEGEKNFFVGADFIRPQKEIKMAQIYLALYKNKRSFLKEPWKATADAITRFFTKGDYSHCEIAIPQPKEGFYCYSASVQDGGVREKLMPLPKDKWDLIPIAYYHEGKMQAVKIRELFAKTKGEKYDWFGAIGVVLGSKENRSKYFCSEWCAEALGLKEGWRFSPNDLAAIYGGAK